VLRDTHVFLKDVYWISKEPPKKISGGREAIIRPFGDQGRLVEVDTQLSGGDLQML